MISKMRSLTLALTILTAVLTAATALSYDSHYGPFLPTEAPQCFPITECVRRERTTPAQSLANRTTFVFHRKWHPLASRQIKVEMDGNRNVSVSLINCWGNILEGPWRIAEGIKWGNIGPVYCADFNKDGREDFVVSVWQGGCGLASGYYDLAFILSGEHGYKVSVVATLLPGKEDFIDVRRDGLCQFVHTAFVYDDQPVNPHNYWVYSLFAIDGNHLRLANEMLPGFPKWPSKPHLSSGKIAILDQTPGR